MCKRAKQLSGYQVRLILSHRITHTHHFNACTRIIRLYMGGFKCLVGSVCRGHRRTQKSWAPLPTHKALTQRATPPNPLATPLSSTPGRPYLQTTHFSNDVQISIYKISKGASTRQSSSRYNREVHDNWYVGNR